MTRTSKATSIVSALPTGEAKITRIIINISRVRPKCADPPSLAAPDFGFEASSTFLKDPLVTCCKRLPQAFEAGSLNRPAQPSTRLH